MSNLIKIKDEKNMVNESSFVNYGYVNHILTNKVQIESCTEFLEYVFYIKNFEDQEIWFRGLSDESYDLVPRLHRVRSNYSYQLENDLFTKFIKKAKHLLHSKNLNKLEWMHVMQHYGLPTRLLDWSEGALIGLYFAVRYKDINTPCVWILVPGKLNNLVFGKNLILVTDNDISNEDDSIIEKYIDFKNLPELPIAISPTYIDSRIQAQKSVFTLHGKFYSDLSNPKITESMKFYQIKIKTESADRIRKQLHLLGINESTLFPDLEGISRDLEFEYELGKQRWFLEYRKF